MSTLRLVLLALPFATFSTQGIAQNQSIDSLTNLYEQAPVENRIAIINDIIGICLNSSEYELGIKWCTTGDSLANLLDSTEQRVRFLLDKFDFLTNLKRGPENEFIIQQAEDIAKASAPKELSVVHVSRANLSLRQGAFPEAMSLYKQAIAVAHQYDDLHMEAVAWEGVGIVHYYLAQPDSSCQAFIKTLAVLREEGRTRKFPQLMLMIGAAFDLGGFQDSAEFYLLQADSLLRIQGEKGSYVLRIRILNNLGNVYLKHGDFLAALDNYTIALDLIAQKDGPQFETDYYRISMNMANVLREVGDLETSIKMLRPVARRKAVNAMNPARASQGLFQAFAELEQFDSCKVYMDLAEEIYGWSQNAQVKALWLDLVGRYQHHEGNYAAALETRREQYQILTSNKLLTDIHETYFGLALNFDHLGQSDSAIYYGEKTLEGNTKVYEWGQAHATLANAYARKGQYKIALDHQRKSQEAADSLQKEKVAQEINFIRLQKERAENEALALEAKTSKAQTIAMEAETKQAQQGLFAALGGVLLLLIVAIIVWFSRQKQAKLTREVTAQRDTISERDSEKAILLKEIHHRVKNNFQIISSLLELQSKGIEDEKAQELAQEGKNRVKSMALIHQKLYQNDDLLVYFDEYTGKLVEEISNIYGKEQHPEISVNVPKYSFDIDTAIPLGLIINELVTNAFKYGFSKQEKRLNISIAKQDDDTYKLEVQDNGVGMPQNFDFSKAKSLGLKLVRRLSKQLQGTVSYSNDGGCSFVVFFKDSNARVLVD